MLSVPYFERELYRLPEEQVTPERILALADEVEERIEGGPASRPLMRCERVAPGQLGTACDGRQETAGRRG